MKKKTINKITLFTALGMGVILLASCTANFCTGGDKARIMYTYDTGTCRVLTTTEYNQAKQEYESQPGKKDKFDEDYLNFTIEGNSNVRFVQYYSDNTNNYQKDYNDNPAKTITDVVSTAKASKIIIPSKKYWLEMDKFTVKNAIEQYKTDSRWNGNIPVQPSELKKEHFISDKNDKNGLKILDAYGYVKFGEGTKTNGNMTLWNNWDSWTKQLRENTTDPNLGVNNCPNKDFTLLYKNTLNTKVNNIRSCITVNGGTYGNFGYNHNRVELEKVTWGSAFQRGFLEGLLVFPVAYLVEFFSTSFGMGGWGQLGAILLVTFIVRTFLLLVSLKSTIGQQKMTMLQPELAKIQAKYPNANTNMAQKQRLSQEQMALYKKNKINPLGTLLVLIVQFPLFIGVWGAMQGSASLATDKVMNLYLSDSIWTTLLQFSSGWKGNTNGCWTAFALIIIMSAMQFVSMQLPQWMQKARAKKHPQAKLTANPAMNKSQRQMKIFSYVMLAIIIIMGFTLPAGMGVYWLAGALFSVVQTVVMQLAMNGDFKRFGLWVKKTTLKFVSLFKKKEVDNTNKGE